MQPTQAFRILIDAILLKMEQVGILKLLEDITTVENNSTKRYNFDWVMLNITKCAKG